MAVIIKRRTKMVSIRLLDGVLKNDSCQSVKQVNSPWTSRNSMTQGLFFQTERYWPLLFH